jgi:hypothetical protein
MPTKHRWPFRRRQRISCAPKQKALKNDGGLGAVGDLCRLYGRHRKRHPDVHPVIALEVGSYQHANKEYGRIKFPRFTPAGWQPKAKFNAALVAAGFAPATVAPLSEGDAPDDDLNDNIPF